MDRRWCTCASTSGASRPPASHSTPSTLGSHRLLRSNRSIDPWAGWRGRGWSQEPPAVDVVAELLDTPWLAARNDARPWWERDKKPIASTSQSTPAPQPLHPNRRQQRPAASAVEVADDGFAGLQADRSSMPGWAAKSPVLSGLQADASRMPGWASRSPSTIAPSSSSSGPVGASVDSALWPHWSTLDPKARPPSPVRGKLSQQPTGSLVCLQHTSAMSAFLSQPRDRTFNWSSDPFIEVTKRASCGSSFGADRHRKKPRREFTVAKDPPPSLVGFLCAGLRTTARTATPPTCGRSQAAEN